MKKILIAAFMLMVTTALGQNVHIDTLNLFNLNFSTDTFRFPIIRSGNNTIDSLINEDLKNTFTYNNYPNEPVDSAIIKSAGDYIEYLSFKITYNQNNILSLHINTGACGCSYCDDWSIYFNYSTVNGKRLAISDVIDTSGAFRTMVYQEMDNQFKRQKKALLKIAEDNTSEADKPSLEWALEWYESCNKSFHLSTFAIYPDQLEIIFDCDFPHAIESLAPVFTLKYPDHEIEKYLKIKK